MEVYQNIFSILSSLKSSVGLKNHTEAMVNLQSFQSQAESMCSDFEQFSKHLVRSVKQQNSGIHLCRWFER